jgi:hypothetical protein
MKRLRNAAALIREILRDLADERAYRRHLEIHGRTASPEEWRRFWDERIRARYAQAKCC